MLLSNRNASVDVEVHCEPSLVAPAGFAERRAASSQTRGWDELRRVVAREAAEEKEELLHVSTSYVLRTCVDTSLPHHLEMP